MGCDRNVCEGVLEIVIFQSTQPEWAATGSAIKPNPISTDFNPRSPNGLRPTLATASKFLALFQSTQPEWAATLIALIVVRKWIFQSTQPEWAATLNKENEGGGSDISIHAARMGCDTAREKQRRRLTQFQSTQPEWAATLYSVADFINRKDFNPRSPNGLRRYTRATKGGFF